jgi:hypothetical protein
VRFAGKEPNADGELDASNELAGSTVVIFPPNSALFLSPLRVNSAFSR